MATISISIAPEFFDKNVPVHSWLKLYKPGHPEISSVVEGPADKPFEFELKSVPSGVLCVWWYVERVFRFDRHVDACPEAKSKSLVLCQPTQQRAGTGFFEAGEANFVLRDAQNEIVARASISYSPKIRMPSEVKHRDPTSYSGDEWLKVVQDLHSQHPHLLDTNVTEIKRHTFGKVVTPYGSQPMWAYALGAAQRAKQGGVKMAYTLQSVFDYACYFTFLPNEGFVRAPLHHKLETICEMQTMAMRFLVYARDSSMGLGGDHLVDDWTRIPDPPNPGEAEYDCEDGVEEAMAQSILLKTAPGLIGALAEAQRLERLYYSCFAVVTLRLGNSNNWVYHALLLKFDRRWLQQRLGLAVDESKHDMLPPLLLETTAYTTSNWQFKTPAYTKATYAAVQDRIETNVKVCSELIIEQMLYGHAVSLTCPELLESHSIGQIECTFNGKLGLPIKTLMLDADNKNIGLLPCKVTQPVQLPKWLPETPLLLALAPRIDATRPRGGRYPKAQFVIRGKDYADRTTRDKILAMAETIGSVRVDEINVYGDIGGVNVVIDRADSIE